jgi:hypothetical protein
MEFDVLDKDTGVFLSTSERHGMLEGSPLVSVPVLYSGSAVSIDHLKSLIRHSRYKSNQRKDRLREAASAKALDADRISSETDSSDSMEACISKRRATTGCLADTNIFALAFLRRFSIQEATGLIGQSFLIGSRRE